MSTRILAVDPGASGGIVELYPDGRVVAYAMPDDHDLCEQLREFVINSRIEKDQEPVCYLELVGGYIGGQSRPGGNPAPGAAMFKFGSGYGYIRGLLAAFRIRTVLVRPQTWQAGIPGVRGQKDKGLRKRALKEHAARLFPNVKVTLAIADSLCIADYARRDLRQTSAVVEPLALKLEGVA